MLYNFDKIVLMLYNFDKIVLIRIVWTVRKLQCSIINVVYYINRLWKKKTDERMMCV